MSPRSVKHKHNCGKSSIYEFKKRYAKGSPLKSKPPKGRPPIVSFKIRQRLGRVIRVNRRLPLTELKKECFHIIPIKSDTTFRMQLAMFGFNRRVAICKPLMGPVTRMKRRWWLKATKGIDWALASTQMRPPSR